MTRAGFDTRGGFGSRFGKPYPYPWLNDPDIAAFLPDAVFVDVASGNCRRQLSTDGRFQRLSLSPSTRPAWSATSFNGAPGLTGDGTDDILYSADAGLMAFANGDDTDLILVSAYNVTSSVSGDTFSGFSSSVTTNQIARHIRAGSLHRVDFGAETTSGLQAVATGLQVFRADRVGTAVAFYRNGVEDAGSPQTLDAASLTFDRYSVFTSFNGSASPLSQNLPAVLGGDAVIRNNRTDLADKFEAFMLARAGL